MLQKGEISRALQPYFDEMAKCERGDAYWALLHVITCLPDICSALESADGKATNARYEAWCDKYLANCLLNGAERRDIRNKLLHQGRSTPDYVTRYSSFAFGRPAANGQRDHLREDNKTLHLDVGELAAETRTGIQSWIAALEADLNLIETLNVSRNLPTLVKVSTVSVQIPSSSGVVVAQISKTN